MLQLERILQVSISQETLGIDLEIKKSPKYPLKWMSLNLKKRKCLGPEMLPVF